ncbi:DNA-directed RNA polymerase I subunit rpa49 [Olea europaea subsp. europaea]|uniref:DNA-directed RNA polymerase I subunit rpa49 n=1 Tax=Olea europaea subsp. europaea TaxID=158383 RepID=A0A8S0QYL8_OLEEU|nr:DNA-directed RNA polymerase I subunit rpa49 [Olea europaea subsp. europaea]
MAKWKEKKKLSLKEEKVQHEEEEEEEEDQNSATKSRKKMKKKKKEQIDVKVETVAEKKDKISPIIGYFPSGYDPLKNHSEPEASVKVYRNVKKSNRLQMVVSPHGSQVDFVGTNYSGEATAPQLCKYALGVLDKDTQTLRIVPIESNKIFRLAPKIGAADQTEKEILDEANEEDATEKKANELKKLTLMYSTKKNIRQDVKRDALRQTGDPGVHQDLDLKLQEVETIKEALEAATSTDNSLNIPPYNLSATSPDMAYPLDKIILKGEWDYLLDIFEISFTGGEVTPSIYPRFVRNRVQKLEDIEDDAKKRKLAGIFSYITHLIKFKDKHSMDGVLSAKHHKFPSIFSQKFSSLFATSNDSRIPDEKKKLLISYVLVLTMFVDEFKSDPSDIAEDLRMTPVALRPHYEYLGCKFRRENQVLVATLPVPLEFQTIKRKRRK